MILAIDPGTTQSAYVVYDEGDLIEFGILKNEDMLDKIDDLKPWIGDIPLRIEMIASYGMAVGKSVFETCVWIGRFIQRHNGDWQYVYRKEVKMHICGTTKAKDSNIRQSVMDRYGSEKSVAIGTKKQPGPLHGVSKDVWAALAVAITATEAIG